MANSDHIFTSSVCCELSLPPLCCELLYFSAASYNSIYLSLYLFLLPIDLPAYLYLGMGSSCSGPKTSYCYKVVLQRFWPIWSLGLQRCKSVSVSQGQHEPNSCPIAPCHEMESSTWRTCVKNNVHECWLSTSCDELRLLVWSMRESLLEAIHSGQLRSNKCQKRVFAEVQYAAMLDTKSSITYLPSADVVLNSIWSKQWRDMKTRIYTNENDLWFE